MSFIQNLFTSRDNNANGANYVGQQDRIWWNPDTNAFYYSDGNTAGGILISTGSGGNGVPGGPTNSIQINAGNGSFTGSSNLTFNGTVVSIVGNIVANNITSNGLITITDLYSPNFYGNAVIYSNATGYLSSTNLFKYNPGTGTLTVDIASLTGNVTANYFIGDGSQLTNLPVQTGTYSDSNVATLLADFGSNNISTTGAVFVGNINANNVNSNNVLTDNYLYANGDSIFNNIALTGNIDLGNLSIQDETIFGLISDRDIVLDPAGNGIVNINGPFDIHSGNLTADAIFQVNVDGRIKSLVPDASNVEGAFNIIGSTDGAEVFPQNLGVMLHTTGQATIPARIYNDGVANYAAVINRRYNGISSAPTGVLQNQIIGRLGATPYLVDGTWPTISTTRLDMVALEDQSTTAQGSAIKLYTVATGATSPTLTADFIAGQLTMSGNLNPALNSTYTLGNAANQWQGVYLGNSGVYIKDITTGFNTQLSVDSGVLSLANITRVQVGNIQLTNTGLLSTVSTQDIIIGTAGDTGNTVINNAGVKFTDGSVQTTAAIPLVQKGNALGVVPLNASTKIDPIYLPSGAITFKGVWNASNNTPTLADGTGTNGDEYIVGVAGTQDLGSGPITFAVGDFVLYTSSNVWVDIPVGSTGVQSFNGRDGIVTLQSGDVTNALSAGSITNSYLANTGINITYSGGLSGNASVDLGGTLALTNSGVTGITAGTGVSVSGATGNVTISIGQAVGTANSVSFQSISSTTTIAATSNITGGNLNTGGRVVATGNIVTSGYLFGNGSQLTGLNAFQTVAANGTNLLANSTSGILTLTPGNNIVITGNATTDTANIAVNNNPTFGNVSATGNISVTGISNLNSNANVKITGGSTGQLLSTDGAGNLFWISSGNIAPTSGTWTPTLVPDTGSYTLTINNTYYQKIGGVAFCTFDITIASQSSPTGNVIMGNLPFTSASTAATTGSLAVSYYALMNSPTNVVSGAVPGSANTVTMYWQGSSDNSMNLLTGNKLKTTTRLIGSVNYATV